MSGLLQRIQARREKRRARRLARLAGNYVPHGDKLEADAELRRITAKGSHGGE